MKEEIQTNLEEFTKVAGVKKINFRARGFVNKNIFKNKYFTFFV